MHPAGDWDDVAKLFSFDTELFHTLELVYQHLLFQAKDDSIKVTAKVFLVRSKVIPTLPTTRFQSFDNFSKRAKGSST